MVNPLHFIYGVVASFVVYTGYTSTERVREAALRSRLTTFYAEHAPPVPSESKIDRLLSRHEYDEAVVAVTSRPLGSFFLLPKRPDDAASTPFRAAAGASFLPRGSRGGSSISTCPTCCACLRASSEVMRSGGSPYG